MIDLKLELSKELFDEMVLTDKKHTIILDGTNYEITAKGITSEVDVPHFEIVRQNKQGTTEKELYTVPGVLELY